MENKIDNLLENLKLLNGEKRDYENQKKMINY